MVCWGGPFPSGWRDPCPGTTTEGDKDPEDAALSICWAEEDDCSCFEFNKSECSKEVIKKLLMA